MAKKSRPMGYIFPKRIKDAMRGESTRISVSMYVPDKSNKEEIKKDELEIQEKKDAIRSLRGLYIPPDFCPVCNKNMKNLDKKMWRKKGICLDCMLRIEAYLKTIGKYQEYEEQTSLRNYKAYLLDIREQAVEFVSNLKDEIKVVNHDGSFDTLKGDQQKVRDFINNEIADLDRKLAEVEDIDMSISALDSMGIKILPLAKELYEKEKENKQKLAETEIGKTSK